MNQWSLKKILIRLITYPFCGALIAVGYTMITDQTPYKTIVAGLGALVIASIYLVVDVRLIIIDYKRRKHK